MGEREGYHRRRSGWKPSAAQRRVLYGVARGDTNATITNSLKLSPATVKWHVGVLLAETGCADRQQLARWWETRERRPAAAPLTLRLLRRGTPPLGGLAICGLVAALLVAAVGTRTSSSIRATGLATPSAAERSPAATGPEDVGLLVVHDGGPLRVDNRASAAVPALSAGDEIAFPAAVQWEPPPGVSISADSATGLWSWLMASVSVGGTKLYLSAESGQRGQGLDVRAMTRVGRLPPTHADFPGEFFFTTCDPKQCLVSYRVRQLVAPASGTVLCEQGPAFDLDTGSYVLHFRDAGTLTNNPTWHGAAGNCGPSRPVRAGDVVMENSATT